jgi:transcription termination factor Rho
MDESETTASAAETAAATAKAQETASAQPAAGTAVPTVMVEEKPLAGETLDLNKLQELDPEGFDAVCGRLNFRPQPGRTHHQHIFDLARYALARGCTATVEGFIEQTSENFAMLRTPGLNFLPVPEDVFVPRVVLQLYKLRPAQRIAGTVRLPRDRERSLTLDDVTMIEGLPPEEWNEPTAFDDLTPQYPQGRILLENTKTASISARAIDLLTPLGRGQRGLIVAAPRVGKTILLKEIAKAIRINHPDIELIILLVDERPEEVTDLRREVDAQIYDSTFDEAPQRHVQVAELVLERAKRLVEMRKDVVILLDSITRLARGYNAMQPSKGRIMSGGVEAKALMKPKKFFGAARNVEEGGSLTILATALIETGSRMDDVIFEEFKGTGNMELHLDRALVEKRLYPAIHVMQSATRREELLYHPEEWERVQLLRKTMAALPPIEAMEKLIDNLEATKSNAELLLSGLR